jgi:hypothetical protein
LFAIAQGVGDLERAGVGAAHAGAQRRIEAARFGRGRRAACAGAACVGRCPIPWPVPRPMWRLPQWRSGRTRALKIHR